MKPAYFIIWFSFNNNFIFSIKWYSRAQQVIYHKYVKYTCSMETVQQNGRFTLFSSKFHSDMYSLVLRVPNCESGIAIFACMMVTVYSPFKAGWVRMIICSLGTINSFHEDDCEIQIYILNNPITMKHSYCVVNLHCALYTDHFTSLIDF